MHKRLHALVLPVVALTTLAACGDDTPTSSSTSTTVKTSTPAPDGTTVAPSDSVAAATTPAKPGTTPAAPGTTPAAPGTSPTPAGGSTAPAGDEIALPADPSTPIFVLGSEGGFVPQGYNIAGPPGIVVTADGRLFQAGVMNAMYPGPMLMPITARTITPAGIQRLLGAAKAAGLLGKTPDYDQVEIGVTDASTTVLTITTAAGTFKHSATALGMSPDGKEITPEREALRGLVESLGTLESVVGEENLTPAEPFVPTEYRMVAFPRNPAEYADPSTTDPVMQPVIIDWPSSTGVKLATATQCERVAANLVDTLFAKTTQLTFYKEGTQTYQVMARGVLPGDPTC